MAKVTVRFYTAMKEATGTDRMEIEAANVAQVFSRLAEKLEPAARNGLFDESGKLRSRFTLVLNSQLLDPKKLQSVDTQDGDQLHVMGPIAGG